LLVLEILRSAETAFITHLAEANYDKYRNLLLPTLRNNIKALPASEIHAAALISSVKLQGWSTYTPSWSETLEGIPTAGGERENLAKCIRQFFEKWRSDNRLPLLSISHPSFEPITKSIVIPVEIPQLQVLCTVHLNLVNSPQSQLNTSWSGSSSSRPTSFIKMGDSIGDINKVNNTRPTVGDRRSSNFSYPGRLKAQSISIEPLKNLTAKPSATKTKANDPPLVSVGQIIPAELVIDITNVWNLLSSQQQQPPQTPTTTGAAIKHRFYYEIFTTTIPTTAGGMMTSGGGLGGSNVNNDWLISGRRRGTFEHDITSEDNGGSDGDNKKTFPLLLVPLRPGYLMLPTVEVRSAVMVSDGDDGTSGGGSAGLSTGGINGPSGSIMVTCETDYRSAGKMVLSVAEVESTIVGIDEGKSGGSGGAVTSIGVGAGDG